MRPIEVTGFVVRLSDGARAETTLERRGDPRALARRIGEWLQRRPARPVW